ncbi:hypothetical protein BCR34DRAFT_257450 [Clohesyomyces aquaticus]|uniref:Uncharacterized protein n=1 Tax=Clohesyomyces aquaticus TaxID=1231657 RepID=A0A1Y1ZUN2_9PLEO|nr:hypothetical protein BCR34DRAFT_257450 [Clohesyomyces aquaticus]
MRSLLNDSKPLPPELILTTLSYLPFSCYTIRTISLASPLLHSILQTYETSLTKDFSRRQLPHVYSDFPDSHSGHGYTWLSTCIHHYNTIDHIMGLLTSPRNTYAVPFHNMPLVNCGLLVLYRIAFLETHEGKIELVTSLSLDPLVAVVLALQHCVLTARYQAGRTTVLSQSNYAVRSRAGMDYSQRALRNELEAGLAEAALDRGLEFILGFLDDGSKTIDQDWTRNRDRDSGAVVLNVYHDHSVRVREDVALQHNGDVNGAEDGGSQPITQGPVRERKEAMVYTVLLERVAEIMGWSCGAGEVADRVMEEMEVDDHWLARLSLVGKGRLVSGREWCEVQ